jgi:hypothetical protein
MLDWKATALSFEKRRGCREAEGFVLHKAVGTLQ